MHEEGWWTNPSAFSMFVLIVTCEGGFENHHSGEL